jgi:FkbM family methyltransferase
MDRSKQRLIDKVEPKSLPVSETHIPYFERLLESGVPHEEEFHFFKNFDADSALFLDIGANVGNSALSVFFVCPHWRVVSFEPNPSLKYFMDRVSQFYKAKHGKFEYFLTGLSDRNSDLSLFVPKIDDWIVIGEASICLSHFDDAVVSKRLSSYSTSGHWSLVETTIKCVSFDSFAESNPLLGDEKWMFVKIDVEGAEVQVLEGMRGFIAAKRPIFMIENSQPDVVGEKMAEFGYMAFDYDVRGKRLLPKESGRSLNSFYFPKEMVETLTLQGVTIVLP